MNFETTKQSKNRLPKVETNFTPEECLTTGQAARELCLAPGTLQNWRSEGIGPKFFKHRHRVFYLISEIQTYKKENYILCSSTADWKESID